MSFRDEFIYIILPSANLTTNHPNVVAATIAQAPHLTAMLDMTGSRKKEACGKLDGFKKQVGDAGLMQLLKCAGDFPKAYKDAKAFCGTGGAGGGGSTKKQGSGSSGAGHLCNIAKMQVRLYSAIVICVILAVRNENFVVSKLQKCAVFRDECIHIFAINKPNHQSP